MGTSERLKALSDEIAQLRTELRILEEQLEFVQDVADDARLRAVVSETPLADREAREATDDAKRIQRSMDEARTRLDQLRSEQDQLLERLFEESQG